MNYTNASYYDSNLNKQENWKWLNLTKICLAY